MTSIFSKFRQKTNSYVQRSKRLKRVRTSYGTKIVGASEIEIQEIKQGLDTNIINGKHEKESKRELKRLGFLN